MVSSWNIEDITRLSLLHDFYGELLTQRQRTVYELYHGENLSLAEIAQELGISRQGVHDALKNGQRSLESYEEKLGLVRRFLKTESAVNEIDGRIMEMIGLLRERSEHAPGAVGTAKKETAARASAAENMEQKLISQLEKIKTIIDRLEE